MTREQELDAEVAQLRAVVAAQARALEEHACRERDRDALRVEQEREAERKKALRRERNARHRAKLRGDASETPVRRTGDVSETSHPSPPLDGPPLSSPNPISPLPFIPSPPSASQENAPAFPAAAESKAEFRLTSPKAPRKGRGPSAAEEAYAALQADREVSCLRERVAFVQEHWPSARINRDLAWLAKEKGSEAWTLFGEAWMLYLSEPEPASLNVPYSLGWFLKGRAQWEGKVLKERQQAWGAA